MRTINITISGEQGTGKSQIAERIHHMLNAYGIMHNVDDDRMPSERPEPLHIPADVRVYIAVEKR